MEKFSSLDKKNVKELKRLLEESFDSIYEMTGVKISVGNIGYTKNTLNSTLSAVLADEDSAESGMSAQEISFRRSFERLHGLYGLNEDELGTEKVVDGEMVTLAGIISSSRKYPLVGKRKDGAFVKMTPELWQRS